jgi:hypothetical protein
MASQDLSTPTLTQAVLARFLKSGGYARHLPQFHAALHARRDALIEAPGTCCPELSYVTPQGGLYLWARLPEGIQARQIEAVAASEGVSVRGGEAFLPDGGRSAHIRLCYAAPASAEIPSGIQRLGNRKIETQEPPRPRLSSVSWRQRTVYRIKNWGSVFALCSASCGALRTYGHVSGVPPAFALLCLFQGHDGHGVVI